MAVGEFVWPEMGKISGVSLGVAAAGIKYEGRNDLLVMSLCDGASVAGVFTQNAFSAAPVAIARDHLANGPRFLVINSGNANACTGEAGVKAAIDSCEALAALGQVKADQVLPFSTGVVGEVLPADRLVAALPAALANSSEDNWRGAAEAIMTTDTLAKGASTQLAWEGQTITITGIAKGSGMINPNMATMLSFIATDAAVAPAVLDKISRFAANQSFNRITIDGDTSTNDACILVATGKSEAPALNEEQGAFFDAFTQAVVEVYQTLAKCIVQDGEGATKFVEINVKGGATAQECFNVAYAIGHSPLVKTAMFASDPNWGRIVVAIGYAKVDDLDANKVKVWLDDVLIVENGGRASTYTEEDGQRVFNQERFCIHVDLGRGDVEEKLWTSDLSHEYIKINAEYRS